MKRSSLTTWQIAVIHISDGGAIGKWGVENRLEHYFHLMRMRYILAVIHQQLSASLWHKLVKEVIITWWSFFPHRMLITLGHHNYKETQLGGRACYRCQCFINFKTKHTHRGTYEKLRMQDPFNWSLRLNISHPILKSCWGGWIGWSCLIIMAWVHIDRYHPSNPHFPYPSPISKS